jgi:Zn-dependent peptidase ImmA (M78 family)
MKNSFDQFMPILKAREIIRELCIEEASHIDIEAIALARGAIVKEEAMSGADGRLAALEAAAFITVREDIPERGKKRFVIAHELGHFELHRKDIPSIACTDAAFREWSLRNPREREANYFAAEILMPEDIFKKSMAGQDLKPILLQSLCKEYDMSLTATAIRIATLRPEYALICSSRKGIQWFVVNSEHFPVFLNIRGPVHKDSLAFDCFQGAEVPEGFFPVEPHAWAESSWQVHGKLKEYAIYQKKYDQVLSFLYIEEGWD